MITAAEHCGGPQLIKEPRNAVCDVFMLTLRWGVVVVIAGCNSDTENQRLTLEVQDSVRFDLGFPVVPRHTGAIRGRDNALYYYFADPVTHKSIKFFDADGRFVKASSISAAVDSLGDVGSVTAISLDTIILSRMKMDMIAYSDTAGRCWRTISFGERLRASTGDRSELGCGPNGSSLWKNWIFARSYWQSNDSEDADGFAPKRGANMEYIVHANRHKLTAPYLARVSVVDGSVAWFLSGYYGRLDSVPCAMNESPRLTITRDQVIAFSRYSAELTVVDPISLRVLNRVDVSKSGAIAHYPPPRLRDLDWNGYVRSVKELQNDGGSIEAVWADTSTLMNFVAIRQPVGRGERARKNRDFVVAVFSEGWEYVGAIDFSGPATHFLGMSLPAPRGGFLLKRSQSLAQRAASIHVFDRFILHTKR